MSAKIMSNSNGIVTVKITGKLTYPELVTLQKSIMGIIGPQGCICILITLENFQGWSKEGDWDDMSFMSINDPYINKMAIVGKRKWERLVLMFTAQEIREFPIKYCQLNDLRAANAWLAE